MGRGFMEPEPSCRYDPSSFIGTGSGRGSLSVQTLPDTADRPRINRRVPTSDLPGPEMGSVSRSLRKCCAMLTVPIALATTLTIGCAQLHRPTADAPPPPPPLVVVVAPVLNLSNSGEWDPLKVTDIVASEFQSFPNILVIPVNRVLAALALMGRNAVETPQDAFDLAREFNADATVVVALTEYDPYDPPTVGMTMQWYARGRPGDADDFDPVTASRQASEVVPAASVGPVAAPEVQVQRVFNAADRSVLAEVRSYGARRTGHDSPYGWRIHVKSQELFVRYCCWSAIRSMLLAREPNRTETEAVEAKRWKQDDDA